MVGTLADPPNSVPLPDPLLEEPPYDRWCDIVMKGGVASGVVYPWAILEIARKYRLRNLGGTSVGAMAAAVAAACEYGRRQGHPHSFEVIRQLPTELGKCADDTHGQSKKTVMLSLFQPSESGKRLFAVFLDILHKLYPKNQSSRNKYIAVMCAGLKCIGLKCPGVKWTVFATIFKNYCLTLPVAITLLISCLLVYSINPLLNHSVTEPKFLHLIIPPLLGFLLGIIILWVMFKGLLKDIQCGIIDNDLGLCRGSSQEVNTNGERRPALVEWMNNAIQRGAGMPADGPPLTFEDLWNAPLWPGGSRPQLDKSGEPLERSINLEMVTTNVTHGRPYRLPLGDGDARLFFDPNSWKEFFPESVMSSLLGASDRYRPLSDSDPSNPSGSDKLYELPRGKLPIVVAARLSLSYPLLFSTVPLYAIDFEEPNAEERELRLCRFSDGGLCSNFPVHFFDSALPRWPTFGLSLEKRSPYRDRKNSVWLPNGRRHGRDDSWYRIEREYSGTLQRGSKLGGIAGYAKPASFSILGKFLWSAFLSSKDWRDRTAIKMPHVRRRVVRLGLDSQAGEGQLNIAMPQSMILEMARDYGTPAGKKLCEEYAPNVGDGEPKDAWREHLLVRLGVLVEGLSDLLGKFSAASTAEGHTLATNQLLQDATNLPSNVSRNDQPELCDSQRDELRDLVARVAELEIALSSRSNVPHNPQPRLELRLRPPL